MQKSTIKNRIITLAAVFIIIPSILFARTSRSRRVFSDDDNALKRPVILVFPFLNKTKNNEFSNYKHKLVKDINSTFTTSRVKGITKRELIAPEIEQVENAEVLSRLKLASIAYKTELILIGRYQIYKDVVSKENKIKVRVVLVDAKIGRALFNLEISGFMKLDYYNFLDRITTEIESRLSYYSKNANKIIKMFLRGEESPLNKNNTIILEKTTIALDPTWLVGKGRFSVDLRTDFTYFKMDFHNIDYTYAVAYTNKFSSSTLSCFVDLQYGLSNSVDLGFKIGFVYYSKRKETSDYWNSQGNDFKIGNKVYNPALYLKFKLAEDERNSFNASFTLEIAPNLSKKTHSLPFLVERVLVTSGYGKFGLAFSKIAGNVVPYLNLDIYVLHFDNINYREENNNEDLSYTDMTKFSAIYVAKVGALFHVKHNFIIDFKFIIRKQATIKKKTLRYKTSGNEDRIEEVNLTPQIGFETGFYYKPDSTTYFGLSARYMFTSYFKAYGSTETPVHFETSQTHTIKKMVDIFLIVKMKVNLS